MNVYIKFTINKSIISILLSMNSFLTFSLLKPFLIILQCTIRIQPPCFKMSMDHANIASYMFKADPVCVIA